VNLNVGLFNYQGVNRSQEDFYTTRGDWKIGNKDSLFTTFVHDDSSLTFPMVFNNTLAQNFSYRQSAVVEETHIFTPFSANTVRVAVDRTYGLTNHFDSPEAQTINPVANDPSLAMNPQLSDKTSPRIITRS